MSAAAEELGETCEICLGDMVKSDLINRPCKGKICTCLYEHVLWWHFLMILVLDRPTAECNYNFCINCLVALLSSSKDDFEMASDGNMHVKVHLNCPNCRADISGTIEDTIKHRQKAIAEDLQAIADSDLSAKQLQQKYWRDEDGVQIQQKNSKEDSGPEPLEIDPSLFGGLEFAMSDEEQKFVTQLMTSGCPGQLCQAAQILAGTADMLRQGRIPAMQIATSGSSDSAKNGAPATSMRNGYSNAGLRTNRSHEEHDTAVTNFQRQMERKAREKLRRPLPARMPLCVSLGTGEFEQMALLARRRVNPDQEAEEPKSWWRSLIGRGTGVRGAVMTFVDDEWGEATTCWFSFCLLILSDSLDPFSQTARLRTLSLGRE